MANSFEDRVKEKNKKLLSLHYFLPPEYNDYFYGKKLAETVYENDQEENEETLTQNEQIVNVATKNVVTTDLIAPTTQAITKVASTSSGAISGATAGGFTVGGIVGGGAAIVASVVAVVAATTVTQNILYPKVSNTSFEVGIYKCSYGVDFSDIYDGTIKVVASSGLSTKSQTFKLDRLDDENTDTPETSSISGGFTGLEGGSVYTFTVYANVGYGESTILTSTFETKQIPTEEEMIYGTIDASNYSIDYAKEELSINATLDDKNKYLSNLKYVLNSPIEAKSLESTSDPISLSTFTKGYFIRLSIYADSTHPMDIENNTTTRLYYEAAIYY